MDFRKLCRSFVFAFAGVGHVIRTEQNMRVHVAIAPVVIAAGWIFRVSRAEWIALLLCIGLVMASECVNSALERLADRVSTDEHFLIQHAKDASAAGVLIIALTSASVGAVIFLPRIWGLFS